MIIQFVYFLWNPGTYLDFIEPITGVPTRHLHGLIGVTGPVTRFTGLFAEPAIYSAFIYMCVSARMLRNNCRFTRFDWLASITMLFSLSIYGYFLFSILIGTMLVKTGHAMRALAVAVMVLAPAIGFLALSDNPVAQMIQVRVEAPLSDPSGNVRLNKPFEYYDHLPDQAQAFGIGLGNYDEEFGEGNGIASLLVFLGAFGTAGFAITLGAILVNREFPLAGWVFLGATMLGAPLFTNQYWWLWIGMMLIFGHKPRELASRPEPAVPA
jgi:hypothetical protein